MEKVSTLLTRLPRLTYRRLSLLFAALCLLVLSVLCLVDKLQSGISYFGKLRRKQHASITSPSVGGTTVASYIKHQYEEWLEAEKEKHANTKHGLRRPGSEFMQQQALVQRKRKRALRSGCRRYAGLAELPFTKRNKRLMYALDKSRLFYCAVPKAGCTNWKKVLMVLEGRRQHIWNITGSDAHLRNHFKNLTSLNPEERNYVLQTYPKFMYVRHPFLRLISAYRNKIACDISRQGATFQGFAIKIVTKYREGALMSDLYAGGNFNVTWDEWIRYLTDPSEMDGFNHHWQEFYKLCLPCRIQYDFIGNMETVAADSTYMFGVLGLDRVSYPPTFSTGSSAFYDQYFANTSLQDLQKLWEIYKYDFELFGFAKPDQLNGTDMEL